MEDTKRTRPFELTEQGAYDLTENKEVVTGPRGVCTRYIYIIAMSLVFLWDS